MDSPAKAGPIVTHRGPRCSSTPMSGCSHGNCVAEQREIGIPRAARARRTSGSNGLCRVGLAGSVLVAAGGSALFGSGLGGLAADRAPAGCEEAEPLLE